MNRKLKHAILFLFSVLLTASTVFIDRPVADFEQMRSVSFGYPFQFVSQDYYNREMAYEFPWYIRFNRRIAIEQFDVPAFLESCLANLLVLEAAIYLLETADFRVRQMIGRRKAMNGDTPNDIRKLS